MSGTVGEILNNSGIPNFKFEGAKLGTVVAAFIDVILVLATFLAFFYLVWGAFQYITAGGEKEKLHNARNRLTWAIIGLLVTFGAFLIAQYVAQVLGLEGQTPII